jgi:hypothetical protein
MESERGHRGREREGAGGTKFCRYDPAEKQTASCPAT